MTIIWTETAERSYAEELAFIHKNGEIKRLKNLSHFLKNL